MTSEHQTSTPENPRKRIRTGNVIKSVGVVAAAGLLTTWVAGPRGADKPAPDQPPTYGELAQQSAQHPYDPSQDELLIGNIKIKPSSQHRDFPAGAVLHEPRVHEYAVAHPDESTALTDSSLSLPSAESYSVVARDIDHDGDTDAIAVPNEKG
jgi:hypothetical protein